MERQGNGAVSRAPGWVGLGGSWRGLGGRAERLSRGLGWCSVALGLAELLAPRGVARLLGVAECPGLIRAVGARELVSGLGLFTGRRPAGWLWTRIAGDV